MVFLVSCRSTSGTIPLPFSNCIYFSKSTHDFNMVRVMYVPTVCSQYVPTGCFDDALLKS